MRRLIATLGAVSAVVIAHCNSDPGSASDASTDGPADICDLDAFSGNGNACPLVSNRLCFQECEAGGCRCLASGNGGSAWKCTTDVTCIPTCGPVDDCGAGEASTFDSSIEYDSSGIDADAGAIRDASDGGE